MKRNRYNTIDGFKPRTNSRPSVDKALRPSVKKPVKTQSSQMINNGHKIDSFFGANSNFKKAKSQKPIVKDGFKINPSRPVKKSARPARPNPYKIKQPAYNNKIPEIKISQPQKPKFKLLKRIISWTVVLLIVIGAIYFGSVILKASVTSTTVFKGNVFGLLNKKELKKDENNRTNFLIFGTSEDDPGHDAPFLTDTIIVASYSHDDKKIAMISIPRDLWVQLDETCWVGNYSRINTVYQCASDMGKDEEKGAEKLMAQASQITGLDIQYYAHANFTVAEKIVDAIGGIEIEINSPDPRGIYDPAFDKWCNKQCQFVKYPNGPTGNLDGKHALALMMVRNSHGGYGLPNSNFDREKNQQRIIAATIKKVVSSDTYLNMDKINKILDAIGENLRTNIKTDEVQALLDIGSSMPKDFDFNKIKSIGFLSDTKHIITSQRIGGASVLVPVGGVANYQVVNNYINSELNPSLATEGAEITVLNASDKVGLANKVAIKLREKSIIVNNVGNNEQQLENAGVIYQRNDLPETAAFLKKKIKLPFKRKIPAELDKYQTDFIIILGQKFDSEPYEEN